MECPKEFDDIRPFYDSEFHDKMKVLVTEPGFEHAVRYVLRDINYELFCQELLTIDNKKDFQLLVMRSFLEGLTQKTTKGLTGNNLDVLDKAKSYTFMSNHRDIVLDASLLNLLLIRNGIKTSERAIGNNLLIYACISDLVRLNKSFIVKRDVGVRQMLDAARQLSGYIHFAITKKNESVWIAQREGRSKDSDDRTQESLIKMLGISGEGDLINNLKEINIVPVSISYEYDPCDYLKAHEFKLKRDNPDFKKSQRDDLHSMEIGLLGFKGRVHFQISPCINDELDKLSAIDEKSELLANILKVIDKAIHTNYKIYPGNYIAYDILDGQKRFADRYTNKDQTTFANYLNSQLAKIPDVTSKDKDFLKERILSMYANPLIVSFSTFDKIICGYPFFSFYFHCWLYRPISISFDATFVINLNG